MNLVENKVAIITGGAKGIGKSVALKLADNKAKGIVIVDIDIETARKTANKINQDSNCNCIAVRADVSDESHVKEAFSRTLKEFDTVDILVNSAGICKIVDIDNISMKQWDLTMDINLKGTFLFAREALNVMKKNRNGKIINVASQAGRIGGLIVGPDYPASKAGVICLTKSLAKNVAQYNINVNSVAPGLIATEMTTDFGYDPEVVPLKRIGTPEEIADVILFLASNMSRYITGACIDVNGGMTMI